MNFKFNLERFKRYFAWRSGWKDKKVKGIEKCRYCGHVTRKIACHGVCLLSNLRTYSEDEISYVSSYNEDGDLVIDMDQLEKL